MTDLQERVTELTLRHVDETCVFETITSKASRERLALLVAEIYFSETGLAVLDPDRHGLAEAKAFLDEIKSLDEFGDDILLACAYVSRALLILASEDESRLHR